MVTPVAKNVKMFARISVTEIILQNCIKHRLTLSSALTIVRANRVHPFFLKFNSLFYYLRSYLPLNLCQMSSFTILKVNPVNALINYIINVNKFSISAYNSSCVKKNYTTRFEDWRRIDLEYWESWDSSILCACVREPDTRWLKTIITDDDAHRETYYFPGISRGLKSSVFPRLIAERQRRATRERENRRPRISVIKLPARVARLDAIRARYQAISAASRRSQTYREKPVGFSRRRQHK